MESESIVRIGVIENAWREEGFAVESTQAGKFLKLRATRKVEYGPGIFDAAERANTILRVPDQLVGYMRDAIDRSKRRGEPLNLARLVRRTVLPRSVLLAAQSLVEHSDVGASEVQDLRSRDFSTPSVDDQVNGVSAAQLRHDVFEEEASGRKVDNDEDDGEMSAEAG